MKEWKSPIYVFFRPTPHIEYTGDQRAHIFECASGRCKARHGRDVCRYLDKGDRNSTSNLRKHAKVCWGDETVAAANATRDGVVGLYPLLQPYHVMSRDTSVDRCS